MAFMCTDTLSIICDISSVQVYTFFIGYMLSMHVSVVSYMLQT